MLKKLIKRTVFSSDLVSGAYCSAKADALVREYRARREYYAGICAKRRLVYDECSVRKEIRAGMVSRGYRPVQKSVGTVHTYAFIPRIAWHENLYTDLHRLGPVSEFDYVKEGYNWERQFKRKDAYGRKFRNEMNSRFLKDFLAEHSKRPVDWLFIYATDLEVTRETLDEIKAKTGVPIVNMCLDDKQSWEPQRSIASAFDINWTSARVACDWYLAEGGKPIYMPEGANAQAYRPLGLAKDIPVSFIGVAYGFRKATVKYLKKFGIDVQAFGPGWGTRAVWGSEAVEIINRSRINLGMGGIGYSEWLTNVKTRDFEIPCSGGGIYLTSYNPDLALHFDIGREIVCYRTNDEMLELIRHHLAHPAEADTMAERARHRCVNEHLWYHRYLKILGILGILEGTK